MLEIIAGWFLAFAGSWYILRWSHNEEVPVPKVRKIKDRTIFSVEWINT